MHVLRCVVVAAAVFAAIGCSAARETLPLNPMPSAQSFQQADASGWSIIRLPDQNTDLQGLTEGPDDTIWVADYTGQALWRVRPDGAYHRFDIAPFSPQDVVRGADGDFYLNTPSGAPQIAKMTPEGAVTLIALPQGEWSYGALVVGPDKAVWFTEQQHIGRITVSGRLSQFTALGQCDVAGSGITVGPDGDLWYGVACPGANDEVVKLDPKTGKTKGYQVDSGLQCPPSGRPIVSASDGALWFACNAESDRIGRITTTGKITVYAITGKALIGLAIGPDADIWYVDDLGVASLLGRVQPKTHRSVVYDPPLDAGRMQGIVSGPGRAMWMSAGAQLDVYRVP